MQCHRHATAERDNPGPPGLPVETVLQRLLLKEVYLFADGSCLGNPGPGGLGVILKYKSVKKELSCGYRQTTNNRMELLAVIRGLNALKEPCAVTVVSDSQYVRNGMTSWMKGWKDRNWVSSSRTPVKNKDLWLQLEAACQRHQVSWQWVRGHAGHPENERCDELARTAASAGPQETDKGFESPVSP